MRRALVVALASLAAFAAASPVASAAGPPLPQVKFELHAEGFLVAVKSEIGSDKLVLALDRHGEAAYYEVPAEITEDTVKARFGRLGELDYTFTPKEHAGPCEEFGVGIYEGSFAFTGENEYVHFEVDRARGSLIGPATKGCREGLGPRRPSTPSARGAVVEEEPVPKDEATLSVSSSRHLPTRYLLASDLKGKRGMRAWFNAFQAEKVEGMLVERGAQVIARPSAFSWDLVAGTARVSPPAPFAGTADFTRGAHGRSSWRGSLSVPVLGGNPIRLAGPGFTAKLGLGSLLD
jgi:hypothetical protein